MSEPEQCIICLDSLPLPRSSGPALVADSVLQVPPTTVDAENNNKQENDEAANLLNVVAALDGCEHIIHDACIRSWAQKTNTCPICRNIFHTVRVFNGVDGTAISQYEVEDKKQIAEFDIQQWLGENAEEEPEQSNPCPICNSAEQENVLLLCDSCDAAYHTHCVGLDDIPDGDWYCMECRHAFQLSDEPGDFASETQPSRRRRTTRPQPRNGRGYHVRTRARLRRARQQARNVEWQGPWGQFAGRLYDLAEVDLDNFDDEDEEMGQYRQFQQLDRREVERWRQRFDIAQRWGAQDAFAHNIPPAISEQLQPAPPPPPQETRDERRAWGAFELARAAEEGSTASRSRKRKTRSITASPAEPTQEPERKLKRPRTRRLATTHAEGSGSGSAPSPVPGPSTAPAADATTNGHGATVNGSSVRPERTGPALVSSLLKELEPSSTSDDETSQIVPGRFVRTGASSPVLSPAPSNPGTPRGLSMSPPPFQGRPSSPTLSLSTHIEPRFGPAPYSPAAARKQANGHGSGSGSGSGSEGSDSDSRSNRQRRGRRPEIQQPRPRHARQTQQAAVAEHSPNRGSVITQEEKKSINDIVKSALRPHWHAQRLNTDQYASINRDVSRKLYEEVRDANSLDEDTRRMWESKASSEVERALVKLNSETTT